MKKIRTAAALVAAVILCVALAVPAVFAAGEESKVYTVLGDSIAAGYRLDDYTRDGVTPPSSYAALFAGKVGATKVNNLAKTGSDTSDTLNFLSQQAYIDAVKEADIITLSMGSNDILGPGGKMICASLGISSLDRAGEVINALNVQSKLKALDEYINKPEQVKIFNDAIAKFKVNWVKIIDRIRELNPDAVLIVDNFYNPYKALNIEGVTTLGNTVQGYLDTMNSYIKSHAYNGQKYVIADVESVSGKTNVALLPNFDLDPHPNKDGHAVIADAVYDEYKKLTSPDSSGTTGSDPAPVTSGDDPGTSGTPAVEPSGTTSGEPAPGSSDLPDVPSSDSESGSESGQDSGTPSGSGTASEVPSDSASQSSAESVDVSGVNIMSLFNCSSGNAAAAAVAVFICAVGVAATVVIRKK